MRYRFDEIAYNSTTKKKPTEDDKETYIGLEHLDSECLTISRWGSEVAPVGEKLIMKKGDILFGKRRAYQRKVGIAPFDGIFSAHGMVLRPNEEVINPNFFPFFISSDQIMERAVRISVGGLSPTINWKDLREQEFDIPSLDEQKELADKLWAAYNLKESYKKLLSATDEMVKSQFIEMFKDLPINGKIEDLVERSIASVKKSYQSGDEIEYIDISSIDNTSNRVVETTKHEVVNAPSRAQQCVKNGDILVSTVRPINRNIAVVTSNLPNLVASTGFCVLRSKDEYREYLLSVVKSDAYTERMCDKANGGLYPAVNNRDVLSYGIHIPNKELAQKVSSIYQQADKSKFTSLKSQFIEMFGNPLSSVQRFPVKKLGDCCEFNPRRPNLTLKETDKVSFVPMPSVSENGYLQDVVDEEYGKVKKGFTYFENNDVLFAKITPCMENGKGAIAEGLTNNIGMGSTEFHVLRPIEGVSSPYWLLALTRLPIFRERASKNMTGTGGQKRVPANYLENFMVGLPSIEEQNRFENIYKQADKSKYIN